MYPLSSIIRPEPEPDWPCDGAAGTPRVRIVTTEGRTFVTTAGTDKDLSSCEASGTPGLAQAMGLLSDATSKKRRHRRQRGRMNPYVCLTYACFIGPYSVESGPFSHKF